jgi:branched-chain amino acid transport system permease protein
MLLFLLAAGLSLVFGLMNITNLAHGSFFMLGTYMGIAISRWSDNFFLQIVGAAVVIAILGVFMERFTLRRLHGNNLGQVLLTFGFVFLIADLCLIVWGGFPVNLPTPSFLTGATAIGGIMFPTYRVFVVCVGTMVALFMWWFQEGTKLGAAVRAIVDDQEMAQSMGLNVPLTRTIVFGTGAALAGVGGVIGGPLFLAYPGSDIEVLLLALVVIIVGGIGSLKGAFVGAIVVGVLDNFGKALFPELSHFTIFAPMVLVLAMRPSGLFGRI